MPSRKPEPFRCFCDSCTITGGSGPDGTPLGVLMPASQRVPHLRRVQSEATSRRDAQSPRQAQEYSSTAQDHASAIFALTLSDEGPDFNIQPSRLWSSRNDFQSSSPLSSALPSMPSAPPTEAILHGIRRLQKESDAANPMMDALPSPDICTPDTTSRSQRTTEPKRERSALTKKAHKLLDLLEGKANSCLEKLSLLELARDRLQLADVEQEIAELQQSFDSIKRSVHSLNQRKGPLRDKLKTIQKRFSELCAQHPVVHDGPLRYENEHHFHMPINHHDPIAQITMFIAVVCNVIMGVSRRLGDLILGLLTIMLRWSFYDAANNLTFRQQDILNQIPVTLATALKKFNLDSKTTTYAVCPDCHCTYHPRFLPGSDVPIYPDECNNHPTPETTCNAKLLDNDATSPILKGFIYHHFHDYVGSLEARGDLTDLMDKACDDLMESIRQDDPSPFITDFFQGEFVHTFKGPDEKLFVDRPANEGRYLFVFNVDYFSAEGQTVRGPSASVGLISGACLNLPLNIRYKPENMYIAGIIPGPKEPSKTELNHYLRPVVDDLLVSWERGVHYSRTARHAGGRTSRSAAAIFVNDLPAARQVSQSAAHSSHHYCTRCHCYHRETLCRTDVTTPEWQPKNVDDLRAKAEAWRTAQTVKDQEILFTKNGLRWSELWRLPYWDPPHMLAVDSMHCLLEGLVQYHFREVLGLTETAAKARPEIIKPFHFNFTHPDGAYIRDTLKFKNDVKHIPQIHDLLSAPIGKEGEDDSTQLAALTTRLLGKNQGALRFVLDSVTTQPSASPMTKIQYAEALTNWRKGYPLRADFNSSDLKFGTLGVLERIQEVIRDMDTPSWLRSVPSNFGSAAAGSLKADEWRTMATVYLPVALTSLWGEGTAHPSSSIALSFRQTLDHTMALVCAVSLACMRTMTESRMIAYRNYIVKWVETLKDIHPKAKHTVNAHMAIHIYDFLCLFGPVRSWWCFPFERLIGQLQRLPSNHKFGELEATMLSSFSRATRLKQWLARPDCPNFIKECKVVFDQAFGKSAETDPEESIAESAFGPVPKALHLIISDRQVALRANHKFDNIIFSRQSTHVGNSLIMFYPGGNQGLAPIPGSIQYIIARQKAPVIYAIRRQLTASTDVVDPFLHYPHFNAQIFSPTLSDSLEVVHPEWVMSHYGRWNLDADRAVILTLSRD